MRAAIGPNSRLPNSQSSHSTSLSPRFFATSRAPTEMKCSDGNLLVTIATVFGGRGPEATASSTRLGQAFSGSPEPPEVGNCMSYFLHVLFSAHVVRFLLSSH